MKTIAQNWRPRGSSGAPKGIRFTGHRLRLHLALSRRTGEIAAEKTLYGNTSQQATHLDTASVPAQAGVQAKRRRIQVWRQALARLYRAGRGSGDIMHIAKAKEAAWIALGWWV
jgi:hypothetical protein